MTETEQRHINLIRIEFAKRGFKMDEEDAKKLWDSYLGVKYNEDFIYRSPSSNRNKDAALSRR